MSPHPPHTKESLSTFWSDIAKKTVDWMHPFTTSLEGDLTQGNATWFKDGQLNVSQNCLDRHLPHKANQPAIIWEGDNESEGRTLTFSELHAETCRMANGLKQLGIKKGDVVAIYLPMIPEAAVAMLACARIGAVHTVVFAGFSANALRQRLIASNCSYLITADSYSRGGKSILLKSQADEATHDLKITTLVIQNGTLPVPFDNAKDHWWHALRQNVSDQCPPEPMHAEDPFFILYTSGSTGQPKGLLHTTGGYLVQSAYSHQLVFECKPDELFWCTADVGWITGHSYVVYGPLCNGITTFMFAGIPTWPNPARNWEIIDRYKINVFHTAPTAIRALMRTGNEWLETTSRESLRVLGSVGEPINPEAWQWYYQEVGKSRCPILDTWWQTETGAMMLSPRVSDKHQKPGSASQPLPGIVPVLLDDKGKEIEGAGEGLLAMKFPWPSLARTIVGDHKRYCSTYLHNGYYITGDGAKRDADGDYWITGRVDDVVNISGHRLGTAEVESALVSHHAIAEAAVVGIPHELKGQGIHAFVLLKNDYQDDGHLKAELIACITKEIGAIAKPDIIQIVSDLPKTRSGKIMRRILRKIACKEVETLEELGDLSTLANPAIVEELLKASKAT